MRGFLPPLLLCCITGLSHAKASRAALADEELPDSEEPMPVFGSVVVDSRPSLSAGSTTVIDGEGHQ